MKCPIIVENRVQWHSRNNFEWPPTKHCRFSFISTLVFYGYHLKKLFSYNWSIKMQILLVLNWKTVLFLFYTAFCSTTRGFYFIFKIFGKCQWKPKKYIKISTMTAFKKLPVSFEYVCRLELLVFKFTGSRRSKTKIHIHKMQFESDRDNDYTVIVSIGSSSFSFKCASTIIVIVFTNV